VRESEAQTVCVSALPFHAERSLTLRATLRDCCENAFSSVVIVTTAGFCKRTSPLHVCACALCCVVCGACERRQCSEVLLRAHPARPPLIECPRAHEDGRVHKLLPLIEIVVRRCGDVAGGWLAPACIRTLCRVGVVCVCVRQFFGAIGTPTGAHKRLWRDQAWVARGQDPSCAHVLHVSTTEQSESSM
jgi:hypothetical protein